MTTPTIQAFVDSGGTTPVTSPLYFFQDDLGLLPPAKRRIYLICTDDDLVFEAASDPGVDAILFSIVDGASGSGQPSTAIKLATTEAGLATAVAGAALNLGTSFLSGVVNARQVWIQFDDSTAAFGVDDTLTLEFNELSVRAA